MMWGSLDYYIRTEVESQTAVSRCAYNNGVGKRDQRSVEGGSFLTDHGCPAPLSNLRPCRYQCRANLVSLLFHYL
jgi:hypothetical protein